MVFIVIGTVEYARRLFRLQNRKNHALEDVTKHKEKYGKYLDAKERVNGSRRRNGQALDEKIEFHYSKMIHYQELADKYTNDIQIFMNSFLHDGVPGTPEEFASRIGTSHQARIDFEIQTGRRRAKEEPEIKEEAEEADIKQEPIDEDIKQEVAMPNVVKSEPSE